MTTHSTVRKQSGFTLVELLIVAIILAILAAIVVPQFASSTDDAIDSALRSNLSGIRGAIDLYAQQHGGTFPGAATSETAGCPNGTGGLAAESAGTLAGLTNQLVRYTNNAGESCSISDDPAGGAVEYPFGPYLKADVFPENPVVDANTVTFVTTGDLDMGGADATAWRYDTVSGKFIADDTSADGNGVAYDTY
ncbi:MAG: prepilin-type N-terminal cleavage/methylation domain-containing protein [Gammaproteobacteria bacterium]|jgi:general secretion pathway protein G